jgi:hypothetical protein
MFVRSAYQPHARHARSRVDAGLLRERLRAKDMETEPASEI